MIFVDTGAWIALSDKSDRFHDEAVDIYRSLKSIKEKFVTTDYIIDETVTRLRYDISHAIALSFLELIDQSERLGIVTLIRIDSRLFRDAVSIFRKFDTTVLSFTDCASFAACHSHGMEKAFAFDNHFAMMGISLCKV